MKTCIAVIRTPVIIIFITTAIVLGSPNLKYDPRYEDNQEAAEEAHRLVNCKPSQQYPNLSDFEFNARNVTFEDSACLSLAMFREMGFIQQFHIPVEKLSRFILSIQKRYGKLPYHNWLHGFGALQFSFAILKNAKPIDKNHFTPLEGFALLTAAMCHDVEHSGTDNQFHEAVNSSLAQRYKEQGSILERHHIAVTFAVLNDLEANFVAHLSEDEKKQFVDLIKQFILATDLSTHFKVLPQGQQMASEGFNRTNEQHHEILKSIVITCADFNDQTKDWDNVRHVAKLVFSEFFEQGDEEKRLGLVPRKSMDRNQALIFPEQVKFINKLVLPVFRILLTIYPETQVCMNNIQRNLENWKKAIPYFEEELRKGINQMDILSNTVLDSISNRP